MRVFWMVLWAACANTGDTVDSDVDTDTWVDADTSADTDVGTDSDLQICDYINADDWAVWCGGEVPQRLTFNTSQSGDPECPDYYAVGSDVGPGAADALASAECDDDCVYQRFQAVMVLYCDTRGEYISYRPGGPGQDGDGVECPPLLHVMTVAGTGWYTTFEDYQEDFPCPGNAVPRVTDVETTPLVWALGDGPVALSQTLTVTDSDDAELRSATVSIVEGFEAGLDSLQLTTRPVGISGTWDSRTGTYTLSGDASPAMYQSALRSVAFDSSRGASGTRTLEVVVSDGSSVSVPATRELQVESPQEN